MVRRADISRWGQTGGLTRLGLASGMPTDRTETAVEVSATVGNEWELAFSKTYGPKQSDVIDVA